MYPCKVHPELLILILLLKMNHLSILQLQRISIERTLATNQEFVVCDEAVSALDVSIQVQIITILKDMQEEMGLTYLFISHDFSIVSFISDDVAVMYFGQIV